MVLQGLVMLAQDPVVQSCLLTQQCMSVQILLLVGMCIWLRMLMMPLRYAHIRPHPNAAVNCNIKQQCLHTPSLIGTCRDVVANVCFLEPIAGFAIMQLTLPLYAAVLASRPYSQHMLETVKIAVCSL